MIIPYIPIFRAGILKQMCFFFSFFHSEGRKSSAFSLGPNFTRSVPRGSISVFFFFLRARVNKKSNEESEGVSSPQLSETLQTQKQKKYNVFPISVRPVH